MSEEEIVEALLAREKEEEWWDEVQEKTAQSNQESIPALACKAAGA